MAAFVLQDEFPDLAAELAHHLVVDGERALAAQVPSLRVTSRCRCGDSFCGTMYMRQPSREASWGDGLRNVEVDVDDGMVVLDVADEQIVAIEVLFRGVVRSRLKDLMP